MFKVVLHAPLPPPPLSRFGIIYSLIMLKIFVLQFDFSRFNGILIYQMSNYYLNIFWWS